MTASSCGCGGSGPCPCTHSNSTVAQMLLGGLLGFLGFKLIRSERGSIIFGAIGAILGSYIMVPKMSRETARNKFIRDFKMKGLNLKENVETGKLEMDDPYGEFTPEHKE